MTWKAIILALAAIVIFAAPAFAQDRRVCFDPGTTRPTPEGYAALRETVSETGDLGATGRAVFVRGLRDRGAGLSDTQEAEVELELLRLGLPQWRIRPLLGAAQSDCVEIGVDDERLPGTLYHDPIVFFEAGSDDVSVWGRRLLRYISSRYRTDDWRVCVDGHTDTSGSAEDSLALSRRRAEAVAEELVRQGVRWTDIDIAAHGETRVARPTGDGVVEPLNNRVVTELRRRCPSTSG